MQHITVRCGGEPFEGRLLKPARERGDAHRQRGDFSTEVFDPRAVAIELRLGAVEVDLQFPGREAVRPRFGDERRGHVSQEYSSGIVGRDGDGARPNPEGQPDRAVHIRQDGVIERDAADLRLLALPGDLSAKHRQS